MLVGVRLPFDFGKREEGGSEGSDDVSALDTKFIIEEICEDLFLTYLW